jgi:hypothetical protein
MKRVLLLFFLLAFSAGLLSIYLYTRRRTSAPAVSLPLPPAQVSTPSLLPSPPAIPADILELENEMRLIEADLKKMKEDIRLTPPNFIFTLGLNKE